MVGVTMAVALSAGLERFGVVGQAWAQNEGRGEGRGGGRGMGGMGGGEMFRNWNSPISSPQLKRYSVMLGMSDEQTEAVKVLHEGYQQQVRRIEEEVRTKREEIQAEFRETRDPEVWQGMRTIMEKSRTDRTKVETQFMDDMKSLLTADQAGKFSKVERTRRRESTIGRGRMSGERVDVVRLVDDMKLAEGEQSSVNPLIEQYEEELDRELTKRNAVYEEIMGKMGEMMRNRDMEAAQREMERGREAGKRVRDLNRKFARQINEALPEARRAEFDLAVDKASFPDVYRDTQASRSVAAASGFVDLDADQKSAIAALQDSYARSSNTLSSKLATETEKSENEFTMDRMFNRGPEEGPMMDLRRQRRELDRTTLENLKKILRPEQAERLPKAAGSS
jgi:hypothetical protein